MRQRTINFACLLLAVAGISFGIGQSVGEDHAQADAQAAAASVVKEKTVRKQLNFLQDAALSIDSHLKGIEEATVKTCVNVRLQNTTTPGTGSGDVVCPTFSP